MRLNEFNIRTLETTMKRKIILAAPCLAMLAACGSGSTGAVSYENLQDAPAGSVVLSADTPVEVASLDEVAAIDFDNSPVGASIAITEGDFDGISLEVAEPIAGKPTLIFRDPDADIEVISAVVGELNTWIQSATALAGLDGSESGRSEVINGQNVFFGEEFKSSGTTTNTDGWLSIRTGNNSSIEAYVSSASVGNDVALIVGGSRFDETRLKLMEYSAPTAGGTYTYEGVAVAFGADESSYSSDSARMSINFNDSSGTFTASNFQPDEGAANKVIDMTSTIVINNSTGTISSSSGTITSGDVSNDLAVNGVLGFDNSAVAGGLVPKAQTDGIIGGVYVLPKNP